MNWYKRADGLWEDIEEKGPLRNTSDLYGKLEEFRRRDDYIRNYGFGVPSRDAVEKIKEFVGDDMVLEVGAGHGTWAKLMQDAGIKIVATDIGEEKGGYPNMDFSKRHTEVEELSHMDAVAKYPSHSVLFMSWPPYNDKMATEALSSFGGDKLIYVGEGAGGCTGDDCFHSLLHKEWEQVGYIDIPQWEGIHDDLYLYTRINV